MDERTAAILQEAFDTIERVERGQRERANEPRLESSWTVPPVRRRLDDDLVYKTTMQPEVATMDPETLARWNAWFDDRFSRAIQKQLTDFASLLGEEAALQEKRLLAQIEALREDVRAANARTVNVTPLRSQHG